MGNFLGAQGATTQPTANGTTGERATAGGGKIVVGVSDTVTGRATVRQAALQAARTGMELHLVAAYDSRDDRRHRANRAAGPRDVAHLMNAKGDAEFLVRQAAFDVADLAVAVREHVYDGTLRAGLRRVSRVAGAATAAPVRTTSAVGGRMTPGFRAVVAPWLSSAPRA